MKIFKYILMFVVLGLIVFFVVQTKMVNKTGTVPPQNITDIKQNVESYLRQNISKLSPVKPVLGGNWYIVSVTTDLEKNSGIVTYEDGHIQEVKNFSYTTNDKGEVASLVILSPNTPTSKNGVTGTVTLGPTCPVERVPPDPNCAPRPYSTSINIMKNGSSVIIKTIQSDSNGVFSVELAPGMYVLQTKGGDTLPRCSAISVEVKNGQYTNADISCDTGMR